MMIAWSEEYHKVNPDVKIEISAGGAGKGITDALSGMVDIGMVSREIYPEEETKGAVWVSVAKDAVVGTVNKNNPTITDIKEKGFSKSTLTSLYVDAKYATWGEIYTNTKSNEAVNVYTRPDACGAASVWAGFMGYKQEDLQGIGVSGDPGVAEAVKNDILGIGYNNINFAYDFTTGLPLEGIAIVPLDLNDNGKIDPDEDFYATRDELIQAISEGKYPSPPARDLNLVAKTEFTGATKEFVEWILTDGQNYILENGYLPLPDEKIAEERMKLN
jgi:phosphate transport system substrate-binding protein